MIDLFLKAKHWQLFLLSIGIPILFYFLMMSYMISSIGNISAVGDGPPPEAMFGMMTYMPLLMILVTGVVYGWYWSVGVGLQNKIPEHLRLNVNLFKAFLLIPVSSITSCNMAAIKL